MNLQESNETNATACREAFAGTFLTVCRLFWAKGVEGASHHVGVLTGSCLAQLLLVAVHIQILIVRQ